MLGLGVEKYIETFDYYNDKMKDEAERYKIFAIDVMNGKKYIINLSEERGMCGSGYCSSTYGKMKVEEYKKGSAFTHKPKGVIYIENLQIDPKTLDVKAPLNNNYTDDSGTVTIHNNIFKFSNYGGDRYYPGGYVEINMDNFEQLPRAMEKRPVWIIKGASGTGKTTLASHIQDCFIGSDYKKVTFGKDSTVLMNGGNFSCREMEFPQGANVEIVNSELDGVEKLTFGEGTNITIKNTRIDTLDYPDRDFTEIDFSKCAHIEIINSNLNSVKKIKFKDKDQEEEIMKGVEWEGKIIYDKTLVIDMRDIINREFN